jgi:hypothetical protein
MLRRTPCRARSITFTQVLRDRNSTQTRSKSDGRDGSRIRWRNEPMATSALREKARTIHIPHVVRRRRLGYERRVVRETSAPEPAGAEMLEPGRSAKHFVAPAVERGDPDKSDSQLRSHRRCPVLPVLSEKGFKTSERAGRLGELTNCHRHIGAQIRAPACRERQMTCPACPPWRANEASAAPFHARAELRKDGPRHCAANKKKQDPLLLRYY